MSEGSGAGVLTIAILVDAEGGRHIGSYCGSGIDAQKLAIEDSHDVFESMACGECVRTIVTQVKVDPWLLTVERDALVLDPETGMVIK